MAFRHKRRKRRVTWLPNTGTPYDATLPNGEQSTFVESVVAFNLGPGNDPTLEVPLVLDNVSQETAAVGTFATAWQKQTLAEEVSYGYLLKRVVGKIIVAATGASGSSQANIPPAIWVAAGLIVRRVDEQGVAVAAGEQITPLALSQCGDPWIWRRVWLLGLAGSATGTNPGDANMSALLSTLSATNLSEASALTGTHMDTKIARRIGPEERLFLDVSIRAINGTPAATTDAISFYLGFDYRVLASVIPAAGNRRNASR